MMPKTCPTRLVALQSYLDLLKPCPGTGLRATSTHFNSTRVLLKRDTFLTSTICSSLQPYPDASGTGRTRHDGLRHPASTLLGSSGSRRVADKTIVHRWLQPYSSPSETRRIPCRSSIRSQLQPYSGPPKTPDIGREFVLPGLTSTLLRSS